MKTAEACSTAAGIAVPSSGLIGASTTRELWPGKLCNKLLHNGGVEPGTAPPTGPSGITKRTSLARPIADNTR